MIRNKKFNRRKIALSGQAIHTNRLILKPMTLADEQGFYLMRRDPDMMRFIPIGTIDTPDDHRAEFTQQFHENFEHRFKFTYGIHLRSEADMIGIVIMRPIPDGSMIEIGYWIRKGFWGNGYAAEAQKAMIDEQKESLKCENKDIIAYVMVGNSASKRVLEKIGLTLTGTDQLESVNCWVFHFPKN